MRLSLRSTLMPLGIAAALAAPSVAHATDGYFSLGYGTKAKGMAGAGVALPQDSMTPSVNPAGLAFVGKRADVGVSVFAPTRQYSVTGAPSGAANTFGLTPGTVRSGTESFLVPHLGMNWVLDDKSSFGIAMFGNGGMNTTYPGSAGGGAGTFYGGPAGVNLSQLFVQPTYARKINDTSSWGASAILAYQQFRATGLRNFAPFVSDGTADDLTDRGNDSSIGIGAKAGLQGQVLPGLTLGGSYQTRITMGRLHKYSDLFADRGSFDIPPTATLGLAWKASAASTLAFDVQEIWYSQVGAVANPFSNLFGAQAGDPSQALGGRNGVGFGWRDMTVYKLGYQWQPGGDWTWRAGAAYGRQPVRSSEVLFNILAPGVQEWHFTAGFTRKLSKNSELNFAAMYSPTSAVYGPNPLEVPGQQTIGLSMHQLDIETNWALRF